jgi:hypothetical protein
MFGCNCNLSPETFAGDVKNLLGERLVSVVLYGSAAAGLRAGKGSDYNLLLVLSRTDPATLSLLSGPFRRWVKAGNGAPRVFTETGLAGSADVFPIEMLDLCEAHKILAGKDVVSGIAVSRANLRHQVEFELRGKLLALRGAAIAADGCGKRIAAALVATYSPLAANLRAALRLYEGTVPAEKLAAIEALARHVGFDPKPFAKIAAAKAGGTKIAREEAPALLAQILAALEAVVAAVDALP